MMSLRSAAKFFNHNLFQDTHGSDMFSGQISPYADSTRSSPSSNRRVVSVAPPITSPDRKTVTDISSGTIFILGDYISDFFYGEEIRRKFPAIPVTDQFTVRTIAQTLEGSGGITDAYVAPTFIKQVDVGDSAFKHSSYDLYFEKDLDVKQGDIVHGSGRYYLAISGGRVDDIGFGIVRAVELDSPLSSATFTSKSGELDTDTDEFTKTVIPAVDVFVEHQLFSYEHESSSFADTAAGDKAISFLKSVVATAAVGDTIGDYTILSINDEGSSWKAHGRK